MIEVFLIAVLQASPSPAPSGTPNALQQMEREIAAVVQQARRSVVRVVSVVPADDPAMPVGILSFAGVVFSTDGYIVTDGTGVERSRSVDVLLENETRKPGRVVAVDHRTSIAVLKIDATGLVAASFSAPSEPPMGSFAIVVGNPLGLPAGASVGTLSGANRAVVVDGRRYEGMFQITSPTFPGDCGGLVADSSGRCIGIIHSRMSGSGDALQDFAEQMGKARTAGGATFATPTASVQFVAGRIIKHGRMIRGWAGLSLRPVDDEVRSQLRIQVGGCAEVSSVETGGPADAAGLRRRDIITTWGGAPVVDIAAIQKSVTELERELRVKVTYLRQGEAKETEIGLKIE